MEERLQKIIAARGLMSRRAAEKLITDGGVTVNGAVAELGAKADPERDMILINGEPLPESAEKRVYIMLNKPVGYVTTMSDEKGRKTVRELVEDVGERVYPVGRLDINSEGLLIMTNDGELANRLMHPSFEKEKVYRVTVTGDIENGMDILSEPMELDGYELGVPELKLLEADRNRAVIDMTIREGRNRQIRRMCEKAGLKVTRLTRIAEAGLSLGRLKKGTWRRLTAAELRLLGVD